MDIMTCRACLRMAFADIIISACVLCEGGGGPETRM